jgi:hypothetical protein
MAIVTLDLNSRDDDDLLNFARTHIAAMTGNADYTTPDPTAVAFLALADNFEAGITAANAAIAAATTAISAKDDLRVLLENGLRGRQAYVQKESGGLETKILGAALGVKATATPIGELLAPENLRASFGDMAGEIDLIWDRVRGARSYIIDCREVIAGAAWTQAKRSTKSRVTVTGLTPGKTYEFRVYAVGSAGDGPFSETASKMAP